MRRLDRLRRRFTDELDYTRREDDLMALADAVQDQPELDLASADWRAWQAQMGGV